MVINWYFTACPWINKHIRLQIRHAWLRVWLNKSWVNGSFLLSGSGALVKFDCGVCIVYRGRWMIYTVASRPSPGFRWSTCRWCVPAQAQLESHRLPRAISGDDARLPPAAGLLKYRPFNCGISCLARKTHREVFVLCKCYCWHTKRCMFLPVLGLNQTEYILTFGWYFQAGVG